MINDNRKSFGIDYIDFADMGVCVDNQERKEIELVEAENVMKSSRILELSVISNHVQTAAALMKIINAMKAEDYQLIKLEKLLNRIEELAKASLNKGDETSIYLDCLEDVTKIIKECL